MIIRSLIWDGLSDRFLKQANKDGNYGKAAKTRNSGDTILITDKRSGAWDN